MSSVLSRREAYRLTSSWPRSERADTLWAQLRDGELSVRISTFNKGGIGTISTVSSDLVMAAAS